MTVTVTTLGVGSAGMVTPPYAAVVTAVAGGAAAAADALAFRSAPICRAAFLKFVKELGEPSAPQFTANTIPAPQWLLAVLAAWSQNTQIGLVCESVGREHFVHLAKLVDTYIVDSYSVCREVVGLIPGNGVAEQQLSGHGTWCVSKGQAHKPELKPPSIWEHGLWKDD